MRFLSLRPLRAIALMFIIATISMPALGGEQCSNPWTEVTKNDLAAARTMIENNHPGPADPENPGFKDLLHQRFDQATEKARAVHDLAGYEFTLRYFFNGFHDGHLGPIFRFKLREYKWPGFLIAYRDGQFLAQEPSPNYPAPLPKAGAQLLSCDGVAASGLMTTNVFPYFGDATAEASWGKAAWRFLLDQGNPFFQRPSSCVFSFEGVQSRFDLQWQTIDEKALSTPAHGASTIGLREFGARRFWLSVPTFDPAGRELKTMQALIKTLEERRAELQHAEILVIDVRRNDGGNSIWGNGIIEALWGKAYASSRQIPDSDVDWRLSPGNLECLRSRLPKFEEDFGKGSWFMQYIKALIQAMETAKPDAIFYREQAKPRATEAPKVANPMQAKVFFLTDGSCASACLDFADRLLALEGVTHIGRTTSSDTQYMDVCIEPLPSGLTDMSYPMKVYRNRPRKPNQPYTPKFVWKGNMSDTEALKAWAADLAKAQ